MDASSKPGESTDSPPSNSDTQADSQKASTEERNLIPTTTSSSTGVGSLIGSQGNTGGGSAALVTSPKRNQSPLSSTSQDAVTSVVLTSTRSLINPSSTVPETKSESPTPSLPKDTESSGSTSVTLISSKSACINLSSSSTAVPTSSTSSTTVTLSSAAIGMKRPPSETLPTTTSQNISLSADFSDSDSDPKRKKMRKDLKSDSTESPSISLANSPAAASPNSAGRNIRGAGLKLAKPPVSSGPSSNKPLDKPSGSLGSPAGNQTCVGSEGGSLRSESSTSGQPGGSSGMGTSWEGQTHSVDVSEGSSNSNEESSNSSFTSRVKPVEPGSSSSSGGTAGPSSSTNVGNGGPKVPPIKIVLQSHSHGSLNAGHCVGPSSNTTGNASELDSNSSSQHAANTGFPYVVSSTTDNSSSSHTSPLSSTATTTAGINTTSTASSNSGGGSPKEVSLHPNSSAQTAGQFPLGNSSNSTNTPVPVAGSSSGVTTQDSSSTDQPSLTAVSMSTIQPETAGGNIVSTATISMSTTASSSMGVNASSSYTASTSSNAVVSTSAISENSSDKSNLNNNSAGACPGSTASAIAERDKDKLCGSGSKEASGVVAAGSNSSAAKDDRTKDISGIKNNSISYGTAGPSAILSSSGGLLTASGSSNSSSGSSADDKDKDKPQRVTRSSQRMAHSNNTNSGGNAGGSASSSGGTPSSPTGTGNSPKNSNCPSPSQQDGGSTASQDASAFQAKQQEIQDKLDAADGSNADVHPRKRKIKVKEPTPANSSSSSTSGEINDAVQNQSSNQTHEQPILNCFEMFLNIRKQIERRRKNLFPVTPKPPQGFKDYLMNRGTYVLASNAKSRLAIPALNPPTSLQPLMKDIFIEQEKERHKLRIQHLVEKEKLVLSVEQEILRVHGRAARALSNQALPFSVCTILKDQEVYNLLTPEQEEKDRNARSRYNGRLFLSWLQDVDDKWDKIKESMLLRHHNEAESLHAVQKMDWEWKLKEVGLCEPKANPTIDDFHVPMVHVSDDFDLQPA